MAHEFSPLSPALWVGGVPPRLISEAGLARLFRELAGGAADAVASVTLDALHADKPRFAVVRMATSVLALLVKSKCEQERVLLAPAGASSAPARAPSSSSASSSSSSSSAPVLPVDAEPERVELRVAWALKKGWLVVRDLSHEASAADVRDAFASFGELADVVMERNSEECLVKYKRRAAASRVHRLLSENLFIIKGSAVPVAASYAPDALQVEDRHAGLSRPSLELLSTGTLFAESRAAWLEASSEPPREEELYRALYGTAEETLPPETVAAALAFAAAAQRQQAPPPPPPMQPLPQQHQQHQQPQPAQPEPPRPSLQPGALHASHDRRRACPQCGAAPLAQQQLHPAGGAGGAAVGMQQEEDEDEEEEQEEDEALEDADAVAGAIPVPSSAARGARKSRKPGRAAAPKAAATARKGSAAAAAAAAAAASATSASASSASLSSSSSSSSSSASSKAAALALALGTFHRHPAVYSGPWSPRVAVHALSMAQALASPGASISRASGRGEGAGRFEVDAASDFLSHFAEHVNSTTVRPLTRFANAPTPAHFATPGSAEFDFAGEFRHLQQLEAVEERRLRQVQLERRALLVRHLAGTLSEQRSDIADVWEKKRKEMLALIDPRQVRAWQQRQQQQDAAQQQLQAQQDQQRAAAAARGGGYGGGGFAAGAGAGAGAGGGGGYGGGYGYGGGGGGGGGGGAGAGGGYGGGWGQPRRPS